ncbi:HAMP domain-containing sensor histidine kinase [Vagococcus xieshaowenii]|uniref:Heme sensor protein HssS n=1 Tax=Vagococcus xieshaowenii TaxID=2562451 RepID=A0AAJ5EE26_9ENTE|nr:HAMP domain-containing sensor histidine kinase [Vagococcus xieshaowenii]QCA29124.1 HAMP domain-containing histidine kinase [Vagococcus xieshaowenii]TFZ40899.1 HAMP domain-containing histidine kinase [Vagococcus xieshaowenii]
MKKHKHSFLWIHYTIITFIILMITALIVGVIALFMYHQKLIDPAKQHPSLPIVIILAISVLIGTILSAGSARKILKPLTDFNQALDKVARGDFSVSLTKQHHTKEIRDLYNNFNKMTQELNSIETLRDDFIVNVSHEFKTPLTAIEGYATLLQDEHLDDYERQDYTQMIIQSVHQLSTLTGNILQLSKIENNSLPTEKECFRIDEQIRQVIVFLEPEWSAKQIDLHLDLAKLDYLGHKTLLMQVWTNLISNAIKFSEEHDQIYIQLTEEDKHIKIVIKDTGIGMSDIVIQKAFDKFYQGDSTRHTFGNGLGLALVKRIVDLSGGDIILTSTETVGTTFTILLPKQDA